MNAERATLPSAARLTLTALPGIPHIGAGDDLAEVILSGLSAAGIGLLDGDVLVIAQKIVSKAEARSVDLNSITPSLAAKELGAKSGKDPRLAELILRESREIMRVRPGSVVVQHRLGFVCANAGIDHSNVDGGEDQVLLLPEDPDDSASKLRTRLQAASGVAVGVLIVDSHGRAWRLGTVGTAIGLSGVAGLVDLRGTEDMFGYTLRATQVGAADELAAAASLLMGQAAEGTPVVHARGYPYRPREGGLPELLRPREEDMFR